VDNLTHALTGIALTGIACTNPDLAHDPEAVGALLWATAIGSQAPDFDIVFRLWKGELVYLQQHRGISHSIPMWFLWPTMITLVLLCGFPVRLWESIWLWSFLAVLAHVGLDLLTSYGTQAFWPLSGKRFGLDVLAIVEVPLILIGILGVYFRRQGWDLKSTLLVFGGTALAYILMRAVIRWRMGRIVATRYQDFPIVRMSVVPTFGPRKWHFILQSADRVVMGRIYAPRGELYLDRTYAIQKALVPESVLEKSKVYRFFRWFARHLFVEYTQEADSIRVDMVDLLFRYKEQTPFRAYVRVDRHGEIVEEGVGRKFEWKIASIEV
jgi:inner membrane protein